MNPSQTQQPLSEAQRQRSYELDMALVLSAATDMLDRGYTRQAITTARKGYRSAHLRFMLRDEDGRN
jgi:hypothetical protein